nr:tetratricopeptide repeat protein [Nostoc sp. CHAB 5715]
MGIALKNQGKLDEAIAQYRKAIQLDPKDADAYYNLGIALKNQGKLDEAIAQYRKAIQLDPKHAGGYIGLGNVLSEQKKLDEAIAAYRQALKLPDISATPASAHTLAHNNLGLALEEKGKLEEAIAEYKRSIALDPKYVFAQNNLDEAERLLALQPKTQLVVKEKLPTPTDKSSLLKRSVVKVVAQIREGNSIGTGWVVKRESDRAWIVTNRHVVTGSEGLREPSKEIGFTYNGQEPNKLFLNNINGIKRLLGDGRQTLILTGKFSSSSHPELNQKLTQRNTLKIELPYDSSQWMIAPADSKLESKIKFTHGC